MKKSFVMIGIVLLATGICFSGCNSNKDTTNNESSTYSSQVDITESSEEIDPDENNKNNSAFSKSITNITSTNHFEITHNALRYGSIVASSDDMTDEFGAMKTPIYIELEDGNKIELSRGDNIAVLEEFDDVYLIYYKGQKAVLNKNNFKEYGSEYEFDSTNKSDWGKTMDCLVWIEEIGKYDLPVFDEKELKKLKFKETDIKCYAKLILDDENENYQMYYNIFGDNFLCVLGISETDENSSYVIFDNNGYKEINIENVEVYEPDFNPQLVKEINEHTKSITGYNSIPTEFYGIDDISILPTCSENVLSRYKKELSDSNICEVISANESQIIRYGKIKSTLQCDDIVLWGVGSAQFKGSLFDDDENCAIVKIDNNKYYLLFARCVGIPIDSAMIELYDEDYSVKTYAGMNLNPDGELGYPLYF